MVAHGWGVLHVHFAHSKLQATLPSPAGDHQGRPYGSSGLLPLFMAQVDVYCACHQFSPQPAPSIPAADHSLTVPPQRVVRAHCSNAFAGSGCEK